MLAGKNEDLLFLSDVIYQEFYVFTVHPCVIFK